jgi:hypothetical protein
MSPVKRTLVLGKMLLDAGPIQSLGPVGSAGATPSPRMMIGVAGGPHGAGVRAGKCGGSHLVLTLEA